MNRISSPFNPMKISWVSAYCGTCFLPIGPDCESVFENEFLVGLEPEAEVPRKGIYTPWLQKVDEIVVFLHGNVKPHALSWSNVHVHWLKSESFLVDWGEHTLSFDIQLRDGDPRSVQLIKRMQQIFHIIESKDSWERFIDFFGPRSQFPIKVLDEEAQVLALFRINLKLVDNFSNVLLFLKKMDKISNVYLDLLRTSVNILIPLNSS